MKILIYGECDQYGSGAWCYYETLKEMGHQVEFYSHHTHLDKYESSFFFKVLRRLNSRKPLFHHLSKHLLGFLEKVQILRPQMVIVLKGLLIDKYTIQQIAVNKCWTVLINHDDFFSSFKGSRSVIQFNAIPFYNYIFCTKGINTVEISSFNPRVETLLFSYYPRIHHPPVFSAIDESTWKSDIVFIGSHYPERRKQMEYLIHNINRDVDLKIYGRGWDKLPNSSVLNKYTQNQTLSPLEMAKAIYYSKIALGFLCKENRDDYTQRSFEIPAAKGLLVAERTKRHLSLYEENVSAVFFDSESYHELVEKVSSLLDDTKQNALIRENGFKAVTSGHHTYSDRLTRLLELYKQSLD